MAKAKQKSLSDSDSMRLLALLEDRGERAWRDRWKSHMALPPGMDPFASDEADRERILRYLLLRVLVNQQASFEKVRELCVALANRFDRILFSSPYDIPETDLFHVFVEVAGETGSALYKVGSLRGIKPISLFAYRFKAYEGFLRWLELEGQYLFKIIDTQLEEPRTVFDFLKGHHVLRAGWVGNDPKACRMFVNWAIFIFSEVWRVGKGSLRDSLMIVDGHVAKVFCRAGLLGDVLYEKTRPYIIQASDMRPAIEDIVRASGKVPFYVDNGAFYLIEDGFCSDLEPRCNDCPAGSMCMKRKKWTAYSVWRE